MRLNPFAGLDKPRQVWAWGMYDLANQSFQLLINTLLFSIFLTQYVAPSVKEGKEWWVVFVAGAMILAVVVSPGVGALADRRGLKKRLLIATGLVASVLTACLALLQPGWLVVAGLLYVTAAFCVNLGENFLGSFLPELSKPETMGRVSAIGWTMSYVGALMLLGITAVAVFALGEDKPEQWKYLFVLAGAWFFAGMIPAMLYLRETRPPKPDGRSPNVFTETFQQLGQSVRHARDFSQLARFLGVFFVYSLGTYSVIFYAGIIGDQFGFGVQELCLLALVMALTAGCASVFTAKFQDRLGSRRTVVLFLCVWIAATLALALTSHYQADKRLFWFIAGGIGLGLGGIGTSSRALVGVFTPPARAAEFFGLWGMVFKLAGVLGPASFGVVSARIGQTTALVLLCGFFVAGLVLMSFVDEKKGLEQARAAH
jgi:MFS transporter, UMF1 family